MKYIVQTFNLGKKAEKAVDANGLLKAVKQVEANGEILQAVFSENSSGRRQVFWQLEDTEKFDEGVARPLKLCEKF